ncbi:protein RecA [Striga asiatica]|uniref:Protein RecA n=1 Tax=Striga asiatica TaxID=4170 RepID=A0A5A7R0B3_STRAF|nr:protein RecA [Striga asiatica]
MYDCKYTVRDTSGTRTLLRDSRVLRGVLAVLGCDGVLLIRHRLSNADVAALEDDNRVPEYEVHCTVYVALAVKLSLGILLRGRPQPGGLMLGELRGPHSSRKTGTRCGYCVVNTSCRSYQPRVCENFGVDPILDVSSEAMQRTWVSVTVPPQVPLVRVQKRATPANTDDAIDAEDGRERTPIG